MNPFSWWRVLRQHPVYLREKGAWGRANPYYATLRRYSPLAVMAALVLGVCGATGNPALFAADEDLLLVWCLMCLPGMALTSLVLFGSLMLPALTAPSVSHEVTTGTWEILCVTPISRRQIVLAKMFGALARLRLLWIGLFALSLFQGAVMMCSVTLTAPTLALWGWLLGLNVIIRPWLELFFAALAGMLSSLWVRSAVMALVASYTAVLLGKLLNNSLLWLLMAGWFSEGRTTLLVSSLVPTMNYALLVLLGGALLLTRAERVAV